MFGSDVGVSEESEMLERLVEMLLKERGDPVPVGIGEPELARMFRALCNVRPPVPTSEAFIRLQDDYLGRETARRGVVGANEVAFEGGVALWQGDITRLGVDAIVNAGNAQLLGCFEPLHGCIDNVIHTFAGVQVRLDCHQQMGGAALPTGEVVHTSAYNLPSRYIFHTVGPIVGGRSPTRRDIDGLAACYVNSLERAARMGLGSIAFCCISTGVYGYPPGDAAALAVRVVRGWLRDNDGPQVIFDVFLDSDKELYEHALSR